MLILAVKVVAIFYISFGNMQNSHRALADLDICQGRRVALVDFWINFLVAETLCANCNKLIKRKGKI